MKGYEYTQEEPSYQVRKNGTLYILISIEVFHIVWEEV